MFTPILTSSILTSSILTSSILTCSILTCSTLYLINEMTMPSLYIYRDYYDVKMYYKGVGPVFIKKIKINNFMKTKHLIDKELLKPERVDSYSDTRQTEVNVTYCIGQSWPLNFLTTRTKKLTL
jgi:hypothetical protein